jgi:hypothetical protein
VEQDQTYLRLRSILRKKQRQLPKGASGIILLEISDLAKLMVDEFTWAGALSIRLKEIVSFKYDPFGRRIYKSSSTATSVYAYDGRVAQTINSKTLLGAACAGFACAGLESNFEHRSPQI